jgi:hypothetical protein
MNDPAFNLAMAARVGDSWYQHLSSVANARWRAGWTGDEGGWYAPCGMHESDWENEGYPLPEDPEFPAWAATHYATSTPT